MSMSGTSSSRFPCGVEVADRARLSPSPPSTPRPPPAAAAGVAGMDPPPLLALRGVFGTPYLVSFRAAAATSARF